MRIEDTGIGMSENELERLFKPFSAGRWKHHPPVWGSGLGLAISQRFMWAHERSHLGQQPQGVGSTFIVEMPIVRETKA